MRKPRVIPVVISMVLSAALLFGGWTFYKQVAMASPISDALKAIPGVASATKPIISQDQVLVSVELTKEASLKVVYGTMESEANKAAGGRKLELDIQTAEDAELERIWQQVMFDIAEAMEMKTYSDIPKAMAQAAANEAHVTAVTEMDENNVYITLRNKKGAKYIVLPRMSNKLEVWGNA